MSKPVSKKSRFEVFKRDAFTCQYCGRKAPDVVLQVDHIEPVAAGGTNALLNLVTSCADCNGGKSATKLDDCSAVEIQRRQLEQLQERRAQIDMMLEWQQGLADIDGYQVERLQELWETLTPGWHVNDHGRKTLRKLVRKFGAEFIWTAMHVASDEYIELEGDPPRATSASVSYAWSKLGGIASVRAAKKEKPWLQRVLWIRGIVRNGCSTFYPHEALKLLEQGVLAGVPLNELEAIAKDAHGWTDWKELMYFAIALQKENA